MRSEKPGAATSRVVVLLDLRGMRDGSNQDFHAEVTELAFELWEAAGVLLRAVSPAEVGQLYMDLADWDHHGPDPDLLGDG